jgi:oxygen-independent coproporphyrinogen-3 oxidase
MSGIYLHIPFCKQACHYCDFHFSTTLNRKDEMIEAIDIELGLRKDELAKPIKSIYFGGGTPSMLSVDEISRLIDTIYDNYQIDKDQEITLEANPDDLSLEYLNALANSKVNRLSIGVQSFNDNDLTIMNRAHRSDQAKRCITMAKNLFKNISIDLIYGIPDMRMDDWKRNLEKFLSYKIPHLSAYALTIEHKTALKHFIEKGKINSVNDKEYEKQYRLLLKVMEENDYINYEFSNFGKEGYFSKNNLNYWQRRTYIGIGPSAHSYDGSRRTWNVRNNIRYIQAISKNELPIESEFLTVDNKFNEHIMTGLRTMWGVSLDMIENRYGAEYKEYLVDQAKESIGNELMHIENGCLKISKKGKYLSDGLISDLFMVD